MDSMKLFAVVALLVLLAPPALNAQSGAAVDLVDRVVAVVGDSVILDSDIKEQIERRRAFGEPIPPRTRRPLPRSIARSWRG
jgi:hypothetical protein